MKDYTVTITMTIPIQARNQEQAEERAETMENAVKIDLPKSARWYNGIDGLAHSAEAILDTIGGLDIRRH